MIRKKLIIVDSHLKNYAGHNFIYNYRLVQILTKCFKITILANKSFQINDKIPTTIQKYFEDYFQFEENNFLKILKKFNFLKKIKLFQYLNDKKNNLIKRSNINQISKYKNNILKILKKKSDLIFFHSETGIKFYDLIVTLLFSSSSYLNKKIYIVDRIGTFQNHSIIQIIKHLSFKKNIYFLTDSHNIIKNYKKKGIPIKILPLFFQYDKHHKKNFFEENLNISLYLGPARSEKGFFDIPNILEKIKNIKNIKFHLNYSFDLKTIENKRVSSVLNKISKFNVNIQNTAMTEKQYIKYLQSIDVLIMNYKDNLYKNERTSTIFLDSILNFVIPIVKNNTWMSSLIDKNKILKKLIIKENYKISDVVKYIKNNRISILDEIKYFRTKMLITNNPKNLKNILKINKKNNNLIKSLFYLNNNFLIEKDNEIALKNNFSLIKKYDFKNKSFNLITLLNKILATSAFDKKISSLKILNENNINEGLNSQKNVKLGLFKLNLSKKNTTSQKLHKTINQFLLTNKHVNTVYTLMKI